MGWTYGYDGRDEECIKNLARIRVRWVLMKWDVGWMDGIGINGIEPSGSATRIQQ
jgi:hypothetical protein